MLIIRPLRRLAPPLVALTLAVGAVDAVPAAGHADTVTTPTVMAQTSVSTSAGTCSSVTGSTQTTPFALAGTPATSSATTNATVNNTADAQDVTKVAEASTGTATAKAAGGTLVSTDLSGSGKVTLDPDEGSSSPCNVGGSAVTGYSYTVSLAQDTRLNVVADVAGDGAGEVFIEQPMTPTSVTQILLFGGGSTHTTHSVTLPAGQYEISAGLIASVPAPTDDSSPLTSVVKGAIHIAYAAVGSASTAGGGSGSAFVRLASKVTCGNPGQVAATFEAKAGKGSKRTISKAQFRVAGKLVKTVTKPASGQVVAVPGLAPAQDATVAVTLSLVGGGQRTFSRSYYSCS